MDFLKQNLIPAASAGAGLGFEIGRRSTSFGIGVAKFFTTGAMTASGAVVDYALGLSTNTGLLSGPTASLASSLNLLLFDGIETLAIGGINLGEALTSQSLVAVSSAATTISSLYQSTTEEGNEAVFSLMAFVKLVKREMEVDEVRDRGLPDGEVGIVSLAKALAAWAAVQSMTVEYTDKCLLGSLEVVDMKEWRAGPGNAEEMRDDMVENVGQGDLGIQITSHEDVPDSTAEIVTAEVGHADSATTLVSEDEGRLSEATPSSTKPASTPLPTPRVAFPQPSSTSSDRSYHRDRAYLRRMSKIVLGAYGGPGMIFFGGPRPPNLGSSTPAPTSSTNQSAAEKEDHLISDLVINAESSKPGRKEQLGTWWDTVRGKNDKLIFEHYAGLGEGLVAESSQSGATRPLSGADEKGHEPEKTDPINPTSTVTGSEDPTLPKFWVLTDHNRKEVVLALRGTMSLNELAIDLACDSWDFVLPGQESQQEARVEIGDTGGKGEEHGKGHKVHSGFWRIANAMGAKGKPVQKAVGSALRKNKGYSLVLAGHSLGAGVAAILALMWADPITALTLKSSGLPANRKIHAYCLACPCIISAPLSNLSKNLITSLIHSYDFVSRLSLGSIRDLKRIATWLSYAMNDKTVGESENCSNVVSRAVRFKAGLGGVEGRKAEKEWFLALRKSLEAQCEHVELYPAGTVYHVFEKGDFLGESLKGFMDTGSDEDGDGLRLFKVNDIEKDFGQIVFSSKMLSCHLPHNYDRIITEKL